MAQRLLYKTPVTPGNTATASRGLSEFSAAEDHDHGITGTGLDHGLLSGLGDDDHPQYALLAGRSGGQLLKGGTAVTDFLSLQSTSGVGTTDYINFLVGNNGNLQGMRINHTGGVTIGPADAAGSSYALYVDTASADFLIDTAGKIGINAVPAYQLDLSATVTQTSPPDRGMNLLTRLNPTASVTTARYCSFQELRTNAAAQQYPNGTGQIALYGLVTAQHPAGSVMENATGVRGSVVNNNGGTITTANGISCIVTNDSGTITEGRGLFIAQIDGSTSYGIYQSAATNKNYFAGHIGIGTTNFPSTGTRGLIFGDGTALATMASNTAGLYADDVGGTVKMFAIDEAGATVNLMSPDSANFTGTNWTDLTDGGNTTLHVHDIYALLAGRSGGQTLKGGTAAADFLALQATAGVGAGSEYIKFLVGNNGATEAIRILASGQLKNIQAGNETTGGGTALLGTNSPAVTNTAPYAWWLVTTSDGSQGYIPVWK